MSFFMKPLSLSLLKRTRLKPLCNSLKLRLPKGLQNVSDQPTTITSSPVCYVRPSNTDLAHSASLPSSPLVSANPSPVDQPAPVLTKHQSISASPSTWAIIDPVPTHSPHGYMKSRWHTKARRLFLHIPSLSNMFCSQLSYSTL